MATTLVSPGVQVTVVDQSQYLPNATNSVPFVLLATAQNKISGDGVGVAAGTLAANAGKLWLMTSQRDLSSTFGIPFFYQTTNGTPINGYELNEYGLLAAYSALGVTNQCYVLRADIDLTALTASLTRPVGTPPNGTYWLDTTNSIWGIFQWNQTTGAFTNEVPLVITNAEYLDNGVPNADYGSIGQYAVNALNSFNPIYFKRGGPTSAQAPGNTALTDLYNTWVLVGSNVWQTAWATVQGTNTPTTLTPNNTFTINGTTITVPAASGNTVSGLVTAILNANIPGVNAANIGGSLQLFINSTSQNNGTVTIAAGTGTVLTDLGIGAGTYNAPAYQASPSYTVPRWSIGQSQPEPTGSIWQKYSSVNLGTRLVVKKFNSTLGTFVAQSCTVYSTDADAIYALDATGGGQNIAAGTTFAQVDPTTAGIAQFLLLERYTTGKTIVTATGAPLGAFTINNTFTISATTAGSASLNTATATILGTTAADFVAAVSAAAVPYVSATINSSGAIVFTHSLGGDIMLTNETGTPLTTAQFTTSTPLVRDYYVNGTQPGLVLSNWVGANLFTYTASSVAPDQNPTSGTYWYYSDPTQVDIMIQDNGQWMGYQNVTNDIRGYNLSLTNATGPIISATAPTTQTNTAQSPLVNGDLWVNTSDLENYPSISRWETINGQGQWVLLNDADQTQSSGIVFADARWATNGTTDPVADALPTITSLLTSDYLDIDAPNPELYPDGILLFNTRRSGYNVKTFQSNYFNQTTYPAYEWSSSTSYMPGNYVMYNDVVYVALQDSTNQVPSGSSAYWTVLEYTDTWVTASGNKASGAPYMGRQAQRALIVAALRSTVDTNVQLLEEAANYNLIACPGYPELAPNLAALNDVRNNTAFVIVDTPMRLSPADVVTWATNNNGLGLANGDGLLTNSSYAGAFYPSCQTTDTTGSLVVTAPSHMMIRTIIRSDSIAYPWLAPAGTRRGVIDNALQIGYINSATGAFTTIGVNQGLRDTLYLNNVNPITFIPGVGITNFGNHTLQGTDTALNRINVARLVAFIRGRLESIGKQYLFEPNDQITRQSIGNAITSLMVDLVAKRGLYDYLVVCDSTNNTPATIDANQLWVDIAIEPVKAVEFIYIPMRIENTGAIASAAAA
jgi:hypothetical protein